MGRPLECEAEAESVAGRAVALHRMHDLGIQEKEFRSGHGIRIHITVIPRQLYAAATV